jgi:hypothetical protein
MSDEYLQLNGRVAAIWSADDGLNWLGEVEFYDPNYYRSGSSPSNTSLVSTGEIYTGISWDPIYYNLPRGAVRVGRASGPLTNPSMSPIAVMQLVDQQPLSGPSIGRNYSGLLFSTYRGSDDLLRVSVGSTPSNFSSTTLISSTDSTLVRPALAADKDNQNIYVYYFSP